MQRAGKGARRGGTGHAAEVGLDAGVTFLDFNKPLTVKAPATADTVSLGDAREG